MANIFDLFKQIEKKDAGGNTPVEYIVVGLGNPGLQYGRTRHNAGFLAIDHLAEEKGVKIDRSKFKALVGEAMIAGKRVLLMKPQTFMNASGEAVAEAARFYKCPVEKIIVISDDFLLDVGRLRVRRNGTHGGHNGLKNIIEHLGHDNFIRVKIGVGEKPKGWDLADYVLGRFSGPERETLNETAKWAADAIRSIITDGPDGAMNRFNR